MDQLPTELILHILSFCDLHSYKHLRLVCRRTREAATWSLFEEVHIALLKESYDKLERIAHQPELARAVRKLVFHGDLLPRFGTQQSWERCIDLRPPFGQFASRDGKPMDELDFIRRTKYRSQYEALPRIPPERTDLAEHYKLYKRYQEEQEYWDFDWAKKFLTDVVSKFTHLREARVQLNGWNHYSVSPIWRSLVSKILQGPNNWIGCPTTYYGSETIPQAEPGYTQGCLLWDALFSRTETVGCRPLLTLSCDQMGCDLLGFYWRFLCPLEDVRNLGSPFARLKQLTLPLTFCSEKDNTRARIGLASFLEAAASSLEILELQWLEEDGDDGDPDDDILPSLAHITMPKLRDLTLSLTSTEADFILLLERHAQSLRALSLKDCSIRDGAGTWESVIKRIPGVLHLRRIHLESLLDEDWRERGEGLLDCWEGGEYEWSIIRWCLHGGSTPPILIPDEWDKAHPDKPSFTTFKLPSIDQVESMENEALPDQE